MDEMQTPNHLDDAERSRVRQTLRRYMEESRIGTPTLQVRIIEADTPRHREIPLSTLQRFLTGSHRTSDHHVMLCRAFVKELPYYGEGKDIAVFGAAASAFFQEPLDADTRAELVATLERDVLGSYEAITLPRETGPFPRWENHISDISLALAGDLPWLEVKEDVHTLSGRETRFRLEGVAFYKTPHLHIFLRDLLTRHPKIYALEKQTREGDQSEPERFKGHGHDAAPWHHIPYMSPPSLVRFFEIRFVPKLEKAETS